MPTIRKSNSPQHRLRIADFLVLMGSSALFLTVSGKAQELMHGVTSRDLLAEGAVAALQSLMCGMLVTGLIALARGFTRGASLQSMQPGHWLLLTLSIPELGEPLLQFFALRGQSSLDFDLGLHFSYFACLIAGAIAAVGVAQTPKRRWKLCFTFLTVAFAFRAIGFFALVFEPSNYGYGFLAVAPLAIGSYGMLGALCAVLCVSLTEWRTNRRYDWLHWIGVAILFAPFALIALREVMN